MSEPSHHQLRALAATRLQLDGPHKVDLVVLPPMRARLEPVRPERKAQLAAALEEELHARKDRSKSVATPTLLAESSIAALCETCRGACCKAGETHAFLTRAVLSRVKAEYKLPSNTALLESYLGRVPELAYTDSCIYHGTDGCTLPRTMRSDTCNRYLCYPLKQIGANCGVPGRAQLGVANSGEGEVRALVVYDGAVREM